MALYPRSAGSGRRVNPTWGLVLLTTCWCASTAAEEVSLPAMRAPDGVPAAWKEVKVDWKGSWDETLAANLDMGKWRNALAADESLRQAVDVIARVREIELLEAMIGHFSKDQGQAKRQQAYVTIAESYAAMGDRTRAAQWMQRLIADYPEAKPLVAEALARISKYSNPSGALPQGRAWAEFASAGLESLVKAGALPPNQPSLVQAREQMAAALRAEQRPQAARRYLDSLPPEEAKAKWWREARAKLLLAAGHLPQAAELYALAGNEAYAKELREATRVARPDIDVAPLPPGLQDRLERLDGAIRLTGKKAVQNAESVQDVLARAADSGALQAVDDSLQASSAALLDSRLAQMPADLGPLRQLEQQSAKRLVDALPETGAEGELAKLVRRFPWSQRVQETLVERGEQALREGRGDWSAWAFETAAAHAEAPALLAEARLGLWLALGQGAGGLEAMEQAMAQVPDAAAMPRLGEPGTAGEAKAFIRRLVGANGEGIGPLARSPSGRIQLPAAMASQAPASRNRWESWCLGPWAIRRVESLGRQLLLFGPRYVACYDGSTLALLWHQAAPGTSDVAAEETAAEGNAARIRGLWRPTAMGTTRSSSVGGRVVYALFGRGEGGSDLSAYDSASGRVLWTTQGRVEWEATRILSEPTAGQDCVYVLAMEQDLHGACIIYLVCLAADDAKIVWKRRLAVMGYQEARMEQARYACGLAIHQGSLYISTNMGILAKCEARDGALEWLRTYVTATPGEGALARTRREGSVPLVIGSRVYFAPRDHSGVIALDRQTGQLAWESLLVPSDQVIGLAGRALVVRDADELAALDAATGAELWTRAMDSSSAAPAVLAGQNILVTAGDKLLRLGAQTGQVVEDVAAPRAIGTEQVLLPGGALLEVSEAVRPDSQALEPGSAPAGPFVPPFAKRWALPCRDPMLVPPPASQPPADLAGVLSGARFYCLRLRPACRVIWQMPLREPPDSTGFHGRLVVFTTGPELVAVDKETGALRWRRTLPFPVDFVAGDDRVLVAGRASPESPVMALAPETGAVLWYRWFGQEPRFVVSLVRAGAPLPRGRSAAMDCRYRRAGPAPRAAAVLERGVVRSRGAAARRSPRRRPVGHAARGACVPASGDAMAGADLLRRRPPRPPGPGPDAALALPGPVPPGRRRVPGRRLDRAIRPSRRRGRPGGRLEPQGRRFHRGRSSLGRALRHLGRGVRKTPGSTGVLRRPGQARDRLRLAPRPGPRAGVRHRRLPRSRRREDHRRVDIAGQAVRDRRGRVHQDGAPRRRRQWRRHPRSLWPSRPGLFRQPRAPRGRGEPRRHLAQRRHQGTLPRADSQDGRLVQSGLGEI
ncbi:MAG: PQQ-binding-like beta-propeller repeat protein [Planctomycetota bacterium]|nr:PQQ-binding-like beta-propeller repeat protein [Planctomycetota bacterium]